MDPLVVGIIIGAVLGAIAMLLIAKNNPKQTAAVASDVLASEGRIVAAVNAAKDAVTAHTTATVAIAAAPAPASAAPMMIPTTSGSM